MFNTDIRKTYDDIYKEYEQSESSSPYKTFIVRQFEQFLKQHKPRSVLDIGCGSGVFAIAARQKGVERVVGIDISSEQIRQAQKQTKKMGLDVTYMVDDISNLQLGTKFDLAVSAFGFCYAGTEAILLSQLSAAKRHVHPNGNFFFVVCDPDHPVRENGINYRTYLESPELTNGAILKCDFLVAGRAVATDYKVYWTRETWENLLREAGFQNIAWQEINEQATNSILYVSIT